MLKWVFWLLFLLLAIAVPTALAEGFCGNSICEDGENSCLCPNDCGKCSGDVDGRKCAEYFCAEENICSIRKILGCCGNDICEDGENFATCAPDCEPKIININIMEPDGNHIVRYGEQVLYKVRVDADGKGVIGAKVSVEGPFGKVKLFNDGMHGDGAQLDDVYGAYIPVLSGMRPGKEEINFSAQFREAIGKAGSTIDVYPFVDMNLSFPAEIELGDVLRISGTAKIGTNPVSGIVGARLETGEGALASEENLETGPNGEIKFAYRSTFVDKPGTWVFSLEGKDSFGNDINALLEIMVFEPGNTPKRDLRLVKPIAQSYAVGEHVEVIVGVRAEGFLVENSAVVASIGKNEQRLMPIAPFVYGGTVTVPAGLSGVSQTMSIKLIGKNGGVLSLDEFSFNLRPSEFLVEIVSPQERLVNFGQSLDIIVIVSHSDGSLLDNAEAYLVFGGKRTELRPEGNGVYRGNFNVNGANDGKFELVVVAIGMNGERGEARKMLVVHGSDTLVGIKENSLFISIGLSVGIIVFAIGLVWLRKRASRSSEKMGIARLKGLERLAQKKYFQDKTINKNEYNQLMEEYSAAKREAKGKR